LPHGLEAKSGQLRIEQNQPRDLAITSHMDSAPEGLKIYYNDNDGSLDLHQTLSPERNLEYISWGRVDNNSHDDLIAASPYQTLNHYVYVYMNNTNGALITPQDGFDTGESINSKIELADIHYFWNYSIHELFVVQWNKIVIFANNNGVFDPDPLQEIVYDDSSPYNGVADFETGDINGDGCNDIIACGNEGIKCYHNTQNGEFNANPIQTAAINCSEIDLIEINYDGYPDLAVGIGQTVSVYENIEGYFDFDEPLWEGNTAVGFYCNEITSGDLQGYGANSIIYSGYGSGANYGFFVFKDLNDPPPCPPENFEVNVSPDNHPLLSWARNTEDDFYYNKIYRAVTQSEIPQRLEFSLVHSEYDNTYWEDVDVYYVHQPEVTDKIWYYITALDVQENESVESEYIRFWAVFDPQSNGELTILDIGDFPHSIGISASPNPFNPVTNIVYDLPEDVHVTLAVYNVSGRQVVSLIDSYRQAGDHHSVQKLLLTK